MQSLSRPRHLLIVALAVLLAGNGFFAYADTAVEKAGAYSSHFDVAVDVDREGHEGPVRPDPGSDWTEAKYRDAVNKRDQAAAKRDAALSTVNRLAALRDAAPVGSPERANYESQLRGAQQLLARAKADLALAAARVAQRLAHPGTVRVVQDGSTSPPTLCRKDGADSSKPGCSQWKPSAGSGASGGSEGGVALAPSGGAASGGAPAAGGPVAPAAPSPTGKGVVDAFGPGAVKPPGPTAPVVPLAGPTAGGTIAGLANGTPGTANPPANASGIIIAAPADAASLHPGTDPVANPLAGTQASAIPPSQGDTFGSPTVKPADTVVAGTGPSLWERIKSNFCIICDLNAEPAQKAPDAIWLKVPNENSSSGYSFAQVDPNLIVDPETNRTMAQLAAQTKRYEWTYDDFVNENVYPMSVEMRTSSLVDGKWSTDVTTLGSHILDMQVATEFAEEAYVGPIPDPAASVENGSKAPVLSVVAAETKELTPLTEVPIRQTIPTFGEPYAPPKLGDDTGKQQGSPGATVIAVAGGTPASVEGVKPVAGTGPTGGGTLVGPAGGGAPGPKEVDAGAVPRETPARPAAGSAPSDIAKFVQPFVAMAQSLLGGGSTPADGSVPASAAPVGQVQPVPPVQNPQPSATPAKPQVPVNPIRIASPFAISSPADALRSQRPVVIGSLLDGSLQKALANSEPFKPVPVPALVAPAGMSPLALDTKTATKIEDIFKPDAPDTAPLPKPVPPSARLAESVPATAPEQKPDQTASCDTLSGRAKVDCWDKKFRMGLGAKPAEVTPPPVGPVGSQQTPPVPPPPARFENPVRFGGVPAKPVGAAAPAQTSWAQQMRDGLGKIVSLINPIGSAVAAPAPAQSIPAQDPVGLIRDVALAYGRLNGFDGRSFAQEMNAVFRIECNGVQNCSNESYRSQRLYEGSFQLSREEYARNIANAVAQAQDMVARGILPPAALSQLQQAVARANALPDPRYDHTTNAWAALSMHAANEKQVQAMFPDVTTRAAVREAQQLQPNPTREMLQTGNLGIPHRFSPGQLVGNNMIGVSSMGDVVARIASNQTNFGAKIQQGVAEMGARLGEVSVPPGGAVPFAVSPSPVVQRVVAGQAPTALLGLRGAPPVAPPQIAMGASRVHPEVQRVPTPRAAGPALARDIEQYRAQTGSQLAQTEQEKMKRIASSLMAQGIPVTITVRPGSYQRAQSWETDPKPYTGMVVHQPEGGRPGDFVSAPLNKGGYHTAYTIGVDKDGLVTIALAQPGASVALRDNHSAQTTAVRDQAAAGSAQNLAVVYPDGPVNPAVARSLSAIGANVCAELGVCTAKGHDEVNYKAKGEGYAGAQEILAGVEQARAAVAATDLSGYKFAYCIGDGPGGGACAANAGGKSVVTVDGAGTTAEQLAAMRAAGQIPTQYLNTGATQRGEPRDGLVISDCGVGHGPGECHVDPQAESTYARIQAQLQSARTKCGDAATCLVETDNLEQFTPAQIARVGQMCMDAGVGCLMKNRSDLDHSQFADKFAGLMAECTRGCPELKAAAAYAGKPVFARAYDDTPGGAPTQEQLSRGNVALSVGNRGVTSNESVNAFTEARVAAGGNPDVGVPEPAVPWAFDPVTRVTFACDATPAECESKLREEVALERAAAAGVVPGDATIRAFVAERTSGVPLSPDAARAAAIESAQRSLKGFYDATPKVDSTGDFTFKDKVAADRFAATTGRTGMTAADYAVEGLDPKLAVALASACSAMEADGVQCRITAGYRGLERPAAEGQAADPHNSYHLGDQANGRLGFGSGAAVDISGADAQRWIDQNGSRFGLVRPYGDGDPPHVSLASSGEATRRGSSVSVSVTDALFQQQVAAFAPPPVFTLKTPDTGEIVATGVRLPTSAIDGNNIVRLAADAGGSPILTDDKPVLPIHEGTLPPATWDGKKLVIADDRPLPPTPPPPGGGPRGPAGGTQGLDPHATSGLDPHATTGTPQPQQRPQTTPQSAPVSSSPIASSQIPPIAFTDKMKPLLSCSPAAVLATSSASITALWSCFEGTGRSSDFITNSASKGNTYVPLGAMAAGATRTLSLQCVVQNTVSLASSCIVRAIKPVVTLTASPAEVASGGTASIEWSGTDVDRCNVYAPGQLLIAQGNASGKTTSPKLERSVVIRVLCHTAANMNVNSSITVRVAGDTKDPLDTPLPADPFQVVISASGNYVSVPPTRPASPPSTSGQPTVEVPCDPELPTAQFIQCLQNAK